MVAVPGPVGLPVVGSLWEIKGDPLTFLTRMSREYGDLARFRVGQDELYVLSHPDDVERLLVGDRTKVGKDRITRSLSAALGQGLLTSDGEVWKRQRKLIAPSFQPRHVAAYGDVMVDCARRGVPAEGVVDVHAVMTAVTLDIVVRTLFGSEPGDAAERVGPVLAELMIAFESENRTVWRMVPEWVPGAHRRRAKQLTAELDALLLELVRRRAQRPLGDDLLSRLLEARDEHGRGMDERQLRDEAITVFLAGHETTALTLTYALWLLAEHPEEQERVRAEVLALPADPGVADLKALARTSAVVKETMRLYPAAWAIGREALEPLEVRGHTIPAGAQLATSQWVVHRDARWWVGPERFRPERWLTGETEGMPRFAYFPFGGGPRVCVGNHFATLEATLVLATFLRARKVAPVPGFVPDLVPAVTLRPRGAVPLRVG